MTNIKNIQATQQPAPHLALTEGDDALLRLSRLPREAVLQQLGASLHGLSSQEAQKRLVQYGPNRVGQHKKSGVWHELSTL